MKRNTQARSMFTYICVSSATPNQCGEVSSSPRIPESDWGMRLVTSRAKFLDFDPSFQMRGSPHQPDA